MIVSSMGRYDHPGSFSAFALDSLRTLPSSNSWPRTSLSKSPRSGRASPAVCGWALSLPIAQTFPQNIRDLAHGHEGSGADVTLSCRLRRRHRPNLQIREVSYIYNRSPQHRLPGSHGCLFCICARVPLTETESVGHFLWDGWADVSGGIPQRRPRRPRYLEHSTLSEPDIHSRMDLGVIDLTAILPAAP